MSDLKIVIDLVIEQIKNDIEAGVVGIRTDGFFGCVPARKHMGD